MASDIHQSDCLDLMPCMADRSVDLVIGSPPYAGKGARYGTKQKWDIEPWVEWMADVTTHAVRVSRNVVVWVVNGFVQDGRYNPACEGLAWTLYRKGIRCERPAIWHKNAPPSKRPWFGNDWEFCLAFRPSESTEYFDWEAIAEPPKYKAGGRFRQRDKNGDRKLGSEYPQSKLARPRDVIRVTVGGGHLGSPLAHENEAPFPEKLVEPFVKACCPPDGIVFDPFGGSGTTAAVAAKFSRQFITCDIRASQVDIANRRLAPLLNGVA